MAFLHRRLVRTIVLLSFGAASNVFAHTMDFVELPANGGIQIFVDGNLLNFFPGADSAIAGANFNDGDYVPQLINVNLYVNPAHTILNDTVDITVPAQNPGQITVGLDHAGPGASLTALSPENLALTETGGLQVIDTLTNQRGVQTTIRLEAVVSNPVTTAPEPASFALFLFGFMALLVVGYRRPVRANPDLALMPRETVEHRNHRQSVEI
jgi:hypothetical protein